MGVGVGFGPVDGIEKRTPNHTYNLKFFKNEKTDEFL